MKPIMIGMVAAGWLALATLQAGAATRTWLGGSATWDDDTTANWSGGAVPVNGDIANITSNSAANLDVGFTATGLSGLGTLTLNNPGSGTNTFFLDGSDSLTVTNLNLNARGRIDMSGGTLAIPASSIFYLNGGTFLQSGGLLDVNTASGTGPYFLLAGSTWTMTGGAANTRTLYLGPGTLNLQAGVVNDNWITTVPVGGVFNQTGGNFTQKVNYINVSGGTFNMGGGTNVARQILMTAAGSTINQTGGLLTAASGLEMRTAGNTNNLSGGTATLGIATIGNAAAGSAVFNHTGGTLNVGPSALFIGASGGADPDTYTLNGGALNISGVLYYQQALQVFPCGVLQGYGVVGSMVGYIDNSGRIIADGYGTQRDLDLSSANSNSGYPSRNTTDNTTNRGWFAVNKGRLILTRSVVAATGNSTNNWGEAAADTTIDLVNSAALAFTNVLAGSLTGAVYAADRADVPTGLYKPVGIWSFAGVTCTAAVVTFRYDDASAAAQSVAETDLRMWRYDGAAWVDVTASRDDTAKTITSQSLASWPKATAFFAVAKPQPPSEPPVIQNRPVSNVQTTGATFNGKFVTSGGNPTTVYVLWGETTGSVSGGWASTNRWNAGDWADGTFPATNIALTPDRTYYYTFGASNVVTNVLATTEASQLVTAPPEQLITGALTAQSTDPTGRANAIDTVTFTVTRPITCTNENMVVNYTLGGTATNVTDYTIGPVSGAVAIAQGQASGTIVVSPVYKTDAEKTVVLTLTPGAYPIGAANSATGTLLAVVPVVPTTRTWVGGNGTWDDTTTNNWNPADVPHNGDTINITSNATAGLSIDYTAANLVGTGLVALTIGNPSGATNTLTLNGGDLLPAAALTLNAGGAINQAGGTLSNTTSVTISGGALVQNGGLLHVNSAAGSGPLITSGGTWIMSNGVANTRNLSVGGPGPATFTLENGTVNDYWVTWIFAGGVFNQNGGTFNELANYVAIGGSNSVFNMRGGTNSPRQMILNGLGVITINQTGGVITNCALDMRETGLMTYNLSGGSFYGSAHIGSYANSRAAVNHTGGALWCNQLNIGSAGGNYDCTYTLNGGTLNINLPNNAQAKVYPNGTLRGYGTVPMINYQFQNDGRVIADGYGTATNLDLSMAGVLLNATDNTTNRGWFAVNKGKLLLPPVAVSAGASTVNWGEAAADTTIDLVNSVRLSFTGASPGTLAGALYAADHGDVPPGLIRPVGVWSFGGVICTAATAVFRYDDAAVPLHTVLRVCRYDGIRWVSAPASRDAVSKTLSSTLGGLSGTTTFFAVDVMQGSVFALR